MGTFLNPQKNVSQWDLSLGSQVADFGSGSGHHTLALAKVVGSSGRVFAVDLQKDMLIRLKNEASKNNLENLEVVLGDVENANGSGLKDGSLDAVLVSNILFQTRDKVAIAKEVNRVLKKGGTTLVIDWEGSFGGMGPSQEHVFDKESAVKTFEAQGFQHVRDINAGEHHYGVVLKKP